MILRESNTTIISFKIVFLINQSTQIINVYELSKKNIMIMINVQNWFLLLYAFKDSMK